MFQGYFFSFLTIALLDIIVAITAAVIFSQFRERGRLFLSVIIKVRYIDEKFCLKSSDTAPLLEYQCE